MVETIIDRCPAIYEQPYHVEIFDNLREALENKRPLQPYDPENDETSRSILLVSILATTP